VNPLLEDLAVAISPARLAEQHLGMTLDPWQREALWPGHARLLMNCCRQAGKSTVAALIALSTALFKAGTTTLILSPSIRQSGELFRKCLAAYRGMGRPVIAEAENQLSLILENGSRIVSLPGTSATIRGFSGVELLLVDEAARVEDDLVAAVRPMLAVSGGRFIAMSTPAGQRGWFYEAWTAGGTAWTRIRATADEIRRIPRDFLAEELAVLGQLNFDQEYRCIFGATAAAVFNPQDIERAFSRSLEGWNL